MCLSECPDEQPEATRPARVLTLTPFSRLPYSDIFFAVERRVARHFFDHLKLFKAHFSSTPICQSDGHPGRPALAACSGTMPSWWDLPHLPFVFPDSRSCLHATKAKCSRASLPPLQMIHEDLLSMAFSLVDEPLRIVYLGYKYQPLF
eukprot:282590-Prymnesium_polylepis.1